MSLIFVDCEARGGCPSTGELTEFGAVEYNTRESFHGAISELTPDWDSVFVSFSTWLSRVSVGRPVFVSDNVAFDWQWINDGFWRHMGYNPFGHSGRRIGDFYAGLCRDFRETQAWKRLRITRHDHNPVNDAMGNVEAFERILRGERVYGRRGGQRDTDSTPPESTPTVP